MNNSRTTALYYFISSCRVDHAFSIEQCSLNDECTHYTLPTLTFNIDSMAKTTNSIQTT